MRLKIASSLLIFGSVVGCYVQPYNPPPAQPGPSGEAQPAPAAPYDQTQPPPAEQPPPQQPYAQQQPGLNHWGIEVADLKTAVATFRERGATVSEPSTTPSAFSGGMLANVTDPNSGGRIELSYQPPDGKLRKATEAWK